MYYSFLDISDSDNAEFGRKRGSKDKQKRKGRGLRGLVRSALGTSK